MVQRVAQTNKMRILILIVVFFLVGALFIISNNNLDMYKKENIKTFGKLYLNWISQLISNTKSITGEAVKLNWFSNQTLSK